MVLLVLLSTMQWQVVAVGLDIQLDELEELYELLEQLEHRILLEIEEHDDEWQLQNEAEVVVELDITK